MLTARPMLYLVLICALFAGGAHAAPPAKAKDGEEGISVAEEKEIARSIDLGGLVFPVFDDEMKLQNYIFINARMLVGPNRDAWKYKDRAHFVRDAVLRAAHRTSFGMKTDSGKLDEKLAEAECIRAANEALGEKDALVSMTFTQIASQVGH